MTQMPPAVPVAPAPAPAPKTSGLSIFAFVCSMIFCCPVTTLLGLILGLAALGPTGKPNVKGRGFAIAAILVGLLLTAGYAIAGFTIYRAIEKVKSEANVYFDALNAGNVEEIRDLGTRNFKDSVSQAEARAFVEQVREELGRVEIAGLIAAKPQMQVYNDKMRVELNVSTEKAGDKHMQLLFRLEGGQWRLAALRLESIGQLGDPEEAEIIEDATR